MGEAEREGRPPVTPADDSGAVAASGEPSSDAGSARTPAEIEQDIEQTREELGDTVAALAEKTDVKARAKDKVQDVKESVADKKGEFASKAQAKKDEFASKAQDASPSSIDTEQVAAAAREKAQQPPYIAAGAVVAGFVLGLLVARRRSR
jgi:ElaB/YqjD/DUF883 family membrane-anchored ribosome-binding protein